MSAQTKIEWTDSTWNPYIGCTRVSPACDDCYAARSTPARRYGIKWGAGQPRRRTSAANWKLPLRWNERPFVECRCGYRGEPQPGAESNGHVPYCPECCSHGEDLAAARRRIFCASLADWLDNEAPIEWFVDLLDLIRLTPNLDWLLLTKRIGNWRSRLKQAQDVCSVAREHRDLHDWIGRWLSGHAPANVWLGATVVNQEEADRDIPKLLRVPARVRFLSIEPMLGPITLREVRSDMCEIDSLTGDHGVLRPLRGRSDAKVHWVICGGESGSKARPFVLGHAKQIVRQCSAAGVACFVKQLGARPVNREGVPHPISDKKGAILAEWPEELRVREFPRSAA